LLLSHWSGWGLGFLLVDEESDKRRALEAQLRELQSILTQGNRAEHSNTTDTAPGMLKANSQLLIESRLAAAGFTPAQA
jgi:hypothetical protein